MCFSAAASSENDQGSMNLASNTASRSLTNPSRGRRHVPAHRVLNPALDVGDDPPGIALIPSPIERLGSDAELDDEILAQTLRFGLAALFSPKPDQRRRVGAHDAPPARAADETATVHRGLIRVPTHRVLL